MKSNQNSTISIYLQDVCPNNILKDDQNDLELWRAFKNGSNEAFLSIYKKYFKSLYSYGVRLKDNEDLVKDAIQDIFLELKKNSHGLSDTDCIKFYLFKCLKRKIFKKFKEWEGQREDLVMSESFSITFSHEQRIINKQINLEKVKLINKAIGKLSPRKREAVYYVFYEGMSYQQVSELMDLCDSKSARDLIYKALKCLRDSVGLQTVFY
ncbi:RNA polymerase sigma factor [Echinicola salinicaeni]|uniref:RNA polymerase sigma factor n=1 Tax=Echinicola salinicaeni TaxID=2762757 RepID=UPI00164486B5|nr:sigma-70 family RNA polymerase sigma factor [Echinicola salinicaeni]